LLQKGNVSDTRTQVVATITKETRMIVLTTVEEEGTVLVGVETRTILLVLVATEALVEVVINLVVEIEEGAIVVEGEILEEKVVDLVGITIMLKMHLQKWLLLCLTILKALEAVPNLHHSFLIHSNSLVEEWLHHHKCFYLLPHYHYYPVVESSLEQP